MKELFRIDYTVFDEYKNKRDYSPNYLEGGKRKLANEINNTAQSVLTVNPEYTGILVKVTLLEKDTYDEKYTFYSLSSIGCYDYYQSNGIHKYAYEIKEV